MPSEAPKRPSGYALRVMIAWAVCMVGTFLLFGGIAIGRNFNVVDWQTFSWLTSGWTFLSLTALMFTAVGGIHSLERRSHA